MAFSPLAERQEGGPEPHHPPPPRCPGPICLALASLSRSAGLKPGPLPWGQLPMSGDIFGIRAWEGGPRKLLDTGQCTRRPTLQPLQQRMAPEVPRAKAPRLSHKGLCSGGQVVCHSQSWVLAEGVLKGPSPRAPRLDD